MYIVSTLASNFAPYLDARKERPLIPLIPPEGIPFYSS